MKSMIYECIGLPGAGKSYVTRQISHAKGMTEIAVKTTLERVGRALLFILTHPFFSARLIKIFIKENYKNSKLLKHKFLTIVLEGMAREQKARPNTIIETGFFQLLLSLYERDIEASHIEPIWRWLKKRGYMVYIIEADREIRQERIRKRGRIPRGGVVTDQTQLEEWFNLLERNFIAVKQAILDNFSYEIIQNN